MRFRLSLLKAEYAIRPRAPHVLAATEVIPMSAAPVSPLMIVSTTTEPIHRRLAVFDILIHTSVPGLRSKWIRYLLLFLRAEDTRERLWCQIVFPVARGPRDAGTLGPRSRRATRVRRRRAPRRSARGSDGAP